MGDLAKVRKSLLDILGIVAPDADLTGLKEDKPLREQLEIDSMDFLDVMMELRKRYKIDVPKDDYGNFRTLTDSINYLFERHSDKF